LGKHAAVEDLPRLTVKGIAIAHEVEAGGARIAPVEEIAEVRSGLAQDGQIRERFNGIYSTWK
jgi:hypothetical protein